jgi:hypothetical protein
VNREHFINFIAQHIPTDKAHIEQILKDYYRLYNSKCCQELVQEALDEHELIEYRACRSLFEYILLGEK